MATAAPSISQTQSPSHLYPQQTRTRTGRPIVPMQPVIRRRGSPEQGRALEMLGHALEYLEDSRLYLPESGNEWGEHEAIAILRKASRTVFSECPIIKPLRSRLSQWMLQGLFGG